MRILLLLSGGVLVLAQRTSPNPTPTPTPVERQEMITNLNIFYTTILSFMALCSMYCCYKKCTRQRIQLQELQEQRQPRIQPASPLPSAEVVMLTQENFEMILRPHVRPASTSDVACGVCLENAKTIAFIPCGHSVCEQCNVLLLNTVAPCPLCREPIQSRLQLF